MTMTRDKLIELYAKIVQLAESKQLDNVKDYIFWRDKFVKAALTAEKDHSNDGSMDILWDTYEEPDMSLDNTKKIEACLKDLEKLASTNMLPFDTGCTRSILDKHFGGKP